MAEARRRPVDKEGTIDSYVYDNEGIQVLAKIVAKPGEYVPSYEVNVRELSEGTRLVLNQLRGELITTVKLDITEIMDPKKRDEVKRKFESRANYLLGKHFPTLSESDKKVLTAYLLQNSLGLGELEPLMHDENLEEVAINSSTEPVWVYHKKYGWCKTNVTLKSEESIYDIAAMIGRRIGKQINVLNPVMDAHLSTGDRVNATLFPVSSFGNTITIRKFSRNPWTIPYLIELNCISPQVAGLIWLCIQNELSILVSGGTGSGKTSFLNAISCLIPANQRIISIEDTRELTLPSFLQWIPLVTREPNAEGKGEVTMLDLLVNSLRMRPDRIIMGEVRKQREAEILFEAMHTGHSVYATLHADNASETITRLTTPPISMPKETLSALAGIVVQFRHRRLNVRRTLEFAEVQKGGDINVLYRWDIKTDRIGEVGKMVSLSSTLSLYSGLTQKEIEADVADKARIFSWMVKKGLKSVNTVGTIVSEYYKNPDEIVQIAAKNQEWHGAD
ncbi:MAG: type II/IV secretion system ATPase subunit [Candidatus Micrarchaeota archaeon]|nr:type II/IV secretion system ATPase subunit [Candidatus Micrarchaeota archaeon]